MGKEHSQGDTEQKIIAAATEVFLQAGKTGARMQDIATRAGINKALLHYYFRSKDKLYQKVFETQVGLFFNHLFGSIPETDDIKLFIRRFIDTYTSYLAEHEGLVRFIMWEIHEGAKIMPDLVKKQFASRGGRPAFLDTIQHAVQRGQMRAVDPIHFVISLLGLCVYPFIARPLLEKVFGTIDVRSRTFQRRRNDEIFALVWNGAKPEMDTSSGSV